MRQHHDVLVIGGGVAGAAAALEAVSAGARVLLVRAGPGATALSSGSWHGPLPPLLERALAAADLPYLPSPSALPHPFGSLHAADYAAASHAAAVIEPGTCIVGIAGLPAFPAAALARMWNAPRHATLLLPGTPRAGWSPVALAAALERDPSLLAAPLRELAGVTRAILPPVLGLDPRLRTRERLAALVSMEVAEALGTPPSVPGWRLDEALARAVGSAGVALLEGRVVDRSARGARVESVSVAAAGGATRHSADAFILATGRFVGGGITAADVTEQVDVARGQALREAGLVERALACEVWVEHLGDRFRQVQPVPLTDAVRIEPQALLRAGLHVDAAGRPLDRQDRPSYENVTARGVVIAETAHGLGHAATGGRA